MGNQKQESQSGDENMEVDKNKGTEKWGDVNVVKVWKKVEGFLVTSNHYTHRDKQEIQGQASTFSNLPTLIELIDKEQVPTKSALRDVVNGAVRQLSLYYYVGSHGWETAIRTMKSGEEEDLGLAEAKLLPKQVINVPKTYERQSFYKPQRGRGGGNRGYTRK